MKTLLIFLLCMLGVDAFGQYKVNVLTTNNNSGSTNTVRSMMLGWNNTWTGTNLFLRPVNILSVPIWDDGGGVLNVGGPVRVDGYNNFQGNGSGLTNLTPGIADNSGSVGYVLVNNGSTVSWQSPTNIVGGPATNAYQTATANSGAIAINTNGTTFLYTLALGAGVTNKWQADALAAAQNATNKLDGDLRTALRQTNQPYANAAILAQNPVAGASLADLDSSWASVGTLTTNGGAQDVVKMTSPCISQIGTQQVIIYAAYDSSGVSAVGRLFAAYGTIRGGFVNPHSPVLEPSPLAWDSGHIGGGRFFAEGGTNFVFYFGGTNLGFESPPESIGLAWTTNGTNFVKYGGNPILTPSGSTEGKTLYTSDVRKMGDYYLMLYNASQTNAGVASERIHGAVATDLRGPWTKLGALYSGLTNSPAFFICSDISSFPLIDGGWGAVHWNLTTEEGSHYLLAFSTSPDRTNWTFHSYVSGGLQGVGPWFVYDGGPAFISPGLAQTQLELYRPVLGNMPSLKVLPTGTIEGYTYKVGAGGYSGDSAITLGTAAGYGSNAVTVSGNVVTAKPAAPVTIKSGYTLSGQGGAVNVQLQKIGGGSTYSNFTVYAGNTLSSASPLFTVYGGNSNVVAAGQFVGNGAGLTNLSVYGTNVTTYVPPTSMGTNVNLVAGSDISISSNYSAGVMTYTIASTATGSGTIYSAETNFLGTNFAYLINQPHGLGAGTTPSHVWAVLVVNTNGADINTDGGYDKGDEIAINTGLWDYTHVDSTGIFNIGANTTNVWASVYYPALAAAISEEYEGIGYTIPKKPAAMSTLAGSGLSLYGLDTITNSIHFKLYWQK